MSRCIKVNTLSCRCGESADGPATAMHREPSRIEAVPFLFDPGDEIAVIALGENVRDFALAVQALAKDQRGIEHYSRTSEARGVSASSERRAAGPVLPNASSTWP